MVHEFSQKYLNPSIFTIIKGINHTVYNTCLIEWDRQGIFFFSFSFSIVLIALMTEKVQKLSVVIIAPSTPYRQFLHTLPNPNPEPFHFCRRNFSMVVLHHFLSLAIIGHMGWSYQVRSSYHLAFGYPLVLFQCLGVHSVILIVHLLLLR